MNATQLKYAVQRAETILVRRKAAIRAKHTVPEITFKAAEVVKALNDRAFKVRPDAAKRDKYGSMYLHSFISFNGEREETSDKEAIARETEALTVEHEAVLDRLHLGDAEQALALLKAYEAA